MTCTCNHTPLRRDFTGIVRGKRGEILAATYRCTACYGEREVKWTETTTIQRTEAILAEEVRMYLAV